MGPSLVVMLCSKKELQLIQQNKSQRVTYWPNSGESLQTDSFMITCEDSEKSYFIRNKLNLQHVKEQSNRLLTQIITDSWNENGEPDLKKKRDHSTGDAGISQTISRRIDRSTLQRWSWDKWCIVHSVQVYQG